MQDLIVTLVQADQIWEDKIENLKNYDSLLQGVKNTDLVLLPEMFHTGFTMNTSTMYETMEDGPGIKWLKSKARKMNCAFYTSLIIKEGENYYNRGVFVYPDGRIQSYDKRKTFGLAKENEHFQKGDHEVIVRYREWNFQLQICYDLRFPEIVRNKLLPNLSPAYDVILYVANWPDKRSVHWRSLLQARAIENQSYVVGVNRVGLDGKGIQYSGDTCIVDPQGNAHFLDRNTQIVKNITLNRYLLNETREMLPFLKDRDVKTS